MTTLRPRDGHRFSSLHYFLPGPPDWWNHLMTAQLKKAGYRLQRIYRSVTIESGSCAELDDDSLIWCQWCNKHLHVWHFEGDPEQVLADLAQDEWKWWCAECE